MHAKLLAILLTLLHAVPVAALAMPTPSENCDVQTCCPLCDGDCCEVRQSPPIDAPKQTPARTAEQTQPADPVERELEDVLAIVVEPALPGVGAGHAPMRPSGHRALAIIGRWLT